MVLAAGCAGRALWIAVGLGRLRRWRRERAGDRAASRRVSLACARRLRRGRSSGCRRRYRDRSRSGWRGRWWCCPSRFNELPAEIQEAIVCHELLHVRRRDWIVTVAEQAIRAVLWFHPAIWWLIGQAQLAREQTVDGEVVALTGNRAQYLNALLAMAGNRPALDLAPAALFLRKRHLKNRVTLLLKEVNYVETQSRIVLRRQLRRIVHRGLARAAHLSAAGGAASPGGGPAEPAAQRSAAVSAGGARKTYRGRRSCWRSTSTRPGHVSDTKVLSGPEELRSAALEAILQWHYNPQAMTLPATTQVTMNFKLPGGRRAGPCHRKRSAGWQA